MKLDMMTWQMVEAAIQSGVCLVLPTGSTEQHGPMGFIGTDRICAEAIAESAADRAGAIVAPALAYTPAPFNMGFGGTISLSEPTFETIVSEILAGALRQGFQGIYILNGHGANLAPLRRVAESYGGLVRVRSWWDFGEVNALRQAFYGKWEGMHATPSEIAITQYIHHALPAGDATEPPRALTEDFVREHAGDRHGPPDEHRAEFPDGRVGSHSALARPKHGKAMFEAAAGAVADDIRDFCRTSLSCRALRESEKRDRRGPDPSTGLAKG